MNITEIIGIGLVLLIIIMTFITDPIISIQYGKAAAGSAIKVVKWIGRIAMRIFEEFKVRAVDINKTIDLTNHNIGNVTGG